MAKNKDELPIDYEYKIYSEFDKIVSKYSRPLPNLMFHYTNLHGLLGIVSTESFWMSDLGYLNDSQELSHGFSIINHIFTEKICNKNLFNKEIISMLKGCIGLAANKYKVYSTSFCEEGDLLSQWRGYAEGGVAIAFDREELEFGSVDGSVSSVIYTDQSKESSIYDLIVSMGSYIHDILSDNYKFGSPKVAGVFVSCLLGVAATLKNESFREEAEVRLYDTSFGDYPNLMHRVSNGVIVPYISFPIVLKKAMKKIIVGPSRREDLVINGVRSLLKASNLHNVAVEVSRIPFRRI